MKKRNFAGKVVFIPPVSDKICPYPQETTTRSPDVSQTGGKSYEHQQPSARPPFVAPDLVDDDPGLCRDDCWRNHPGMGRRRSPGSQGQEGGEESRSRQERRIRSEV